ncbi:dethiobiotin synthase [Crocinitomix algicola]|uniref:dethiobiotin synthase n=1 Tax=Crocinitomix algicola TaxID=1740263 RepID=UPI0008340D81|nr:dethiobiotin synthase [Crocinitomix algicola]
MAENRKRIFVSGIGTEIGKTFCSAIVVEALKADYWKPVQAGELDQLDSDWVKNAISNMQTTILSEQFLLTEPMSPHAAARIDGIRLAPDAFVVPETDNHLVIEGAGGLMVPLNDDGDLIIDLIPEVADEVILVSKNYLGSINHTLLSIELLEQRNINIAGIIFNGEPNLETEKVILANTGVKCIGKVPILKGDLKTFVREQAALLDI